VGEGARAFLLRETDCADTASLAARLTSLTDRTASILARYFGVEQPDGS
jgi:hypothetical protein